MLKERLKTDMMLIALREFFFTKFYKYLFNMAHIFNAYYIK